MSENKREIEELFQDIISTIHKLNGLFQKARELTNDEIRFTPVREILMKRGIRLFAGNREVKTANNGIGEGGSSSTTDSYFFIDKIHIHEQNGWWDKSSNWFEWGGYKW